MNTRTGRLTAHPLVILAIVALFVSCPLPFEFAPLDGDAPAPSTRDPANPAITAAPTLRIVERTSGIERDSAEAAVDLELSLATDTRGATIFYRTDGDAPIPGRDGTLTFRAGETIPVTGPDGFIELRALAIGPSMYPSLVTSRTVSVRYEPAVAPSFPFAPGDYPGDITISIAASEPGAEIYFTRRTDTEPAPDPVPGEPGTQLYTGPISLSGSGAAASIAAIVVRDERLPSPVSRGVWTIDYPAALPPVFTPTPGTFTSDLEVTLSTQGAGADAEIFYTVADGASDAPVPQPGTAGTFSFDGPVPIAGPNTTRSFAAIVRQSGRLDSSVARATYTVQYAPAATPQLLDADGTPADSVYDAPATFLIESATPNATIWYTTDGREAVPGDPDTGSGASPLVVTIDRTSRIRAVAVADGFLTSAAFDTTVTFALSAPTMSVTSFVTGSVVEISSIDGATIFYTTDGSDPTNLAGTEYDAPFYRTDTVTVRAYAVRDGFTDSPVTAATTSPTPGTFGAYDDFNDLQINSALWAVSEQFYGRVTADDVFEVADDALAPLGSGALNVYGWSGGGTGLARASSLGDATEWVFTIADETIGEFAGGTQGWYVHALDAETGARVATVMNDVNFNRTYPPDSSPNTGDWDDGAGTYNVALVDGRFFVIRDGVFVRVVDAPAYTRTTFRLQFEANNVYGVSVSRAGIAVDDVRRVE